jgi:hypothetical protein
MQKFDYIFQINLNMVSFLKKIINKDEHEIKMFLVNGVFE